MKLSKRIKCFMYLLYSYIILLAISGIVLIASGGFFLYHHMAYSSIIKNKAYVPSLILLCLGFFIFLLCWMGYKSAYKKNSWYLGLFSVCLLGVIIVELTIFGWSLKLRYNIAEVAAVPVEESFKEFIELDLDRGHLWNRMQTDLHCCGLHSFHDYKRLKGNFPSSCLASSEATLYQDGCLHVLTRETKQNLIYVAVIAIVVAFMQSFGLFCSINLCLLINKIDEDNDSVQRPPDHRNIELLPFTTNPSAATSTSQAREQNNRTKLQENLRLDLERAQADRLSMK